MKKITFISILASIALLASCNKESYFHNMNISYPAAGDRGVVYADQTLDSIVFITSDNFIVSSNESWMTIPEEQATGTIPNTYRNVWVVSVPIQFSPNTTGKPRTGNVTVQSYGDDEWDASAYATYIQVSWPNIIQPEPVYDYVNLEPVNAHFIVKETATIALPDTIKFEAHGPWTVTDGTLFVHPKQTGGMKGVIKLPVDIEANETAEERTDGITLTINGVSTEIEFRQERKSDE